MNPRILLLALGTFALGTDAFVIAGVLPAIGRDLGVSVDTAGLLVAVFSLTYGLGAPFLSAFTGNIDRRKLLLGALLIFTIANVMSALSPNFTLLLLTRILAGCCAALYSPTAYTVAVTLAPPNKRGQALATVIAGLTVSTVLGVPLGTWVGQNLNWRMTFGLVAILGGLAVTILFLAGLPQIPKSAVISLRTRLAPIANLRILLALLPVFLWSIGAFTIYTYVTPFLQQTTHVQTTDGLLLVYGLGAIIGSWGGGYLTDKLSSVRPIFIGLIVLIIILASLPWAASSVVGASIILFIWGMAGWSIFPPQQNRLLTLFPESSNVILALNNSALYLGTAAGATLGGFVLEQAGASMLAFVASGTVFIALVVLFVSASVTPAPVAKAEPEPRPLEVVEGMGL